MAHLILPEEDLESIIRVRRERGSDRFDEVWNGVYVMSPLAVNQHQRLATFLARVFHGSLEGRQAFDSIAGVNVSDQSDEWTKNYRCPDVAVFLPGNPAEDRDSHWFGGPDFAVEIISKGDRSRLKFNFYAKVGVDELLLVDRDPWRLELYRNQTGKMNPAGSIAFGDSNCLQSEILPVSFRLLDSNEGPKIEVTQTDDGRVWLS